MSTDNDKLAREAIKRDTDKNIFVEAGAGSGKTRELVERMTALVAAGTDVSKVCAITFTKAAAREFYLRFQTRLSELAAESTDSLLRERCREALDRIDLCFMGTIDAFSELILREHPVEAGIPSDFEITDSGSLQQLYRRALREIKGGGYGIRLEKLYERLSSVSPDPDGLFIKLITALHDLRDTAIQIPPYDSDIAKSFSDIKREILKTAGCLLAHPEKAYRGANGTLTVNTEKLDDLAAVYPRLKGSWSENLKDILFLLGKADNYCISCPPEEIGAEHPEWFVPKGSSHYAYGFSLELTGLEEKVKNYRYCVSIDLVSAALDRLAGQQLSEGRLSFFDAKLCLRDMLKRDAAENEGRLIRHIRSRRSCYLVDEFQDTDPMQSEILFYLTAEKPDPDWTKCVPVPGSLFIVGDPKQSIYRFRGADIRAFTTVRELFRASGGEILELTRNFRSAPKLKRAFNAAFSSLLPEETPYQSRFRPIPTDEPDGRGFAGIFRYKTRRAEDHLNVLALIKGLVNDPSKLIPDRISGELRPVRYGDIMLILPDKNNISSYMSALDSEGIPCIVEGSTLLKSCPSLTALSNVLSAVAAPDDGLAVYAVLRSDCFRISERELCEAAPVFSLNDHKPTGSERINGAFKALREIRARAKAMPPSAACRYIIERLGLLTRTDTDYLECLFFALDLLRAREADGDIGSLEDAAAMLREITRSNSIERSLRFELHENSVRIANLHKVKGLEANIVILGDPLVNKRAPSSRTEYRDSGSVSYLFSYTDRTTYIKLIETTAFADMAAEEEKELAAEKDRLLYVAATRARCALIAADAPSEGRRGDNYWKFLCDQAEGTIGYPRTAGGFKSDEIPASKLCTGDDPFADTPSSEKSFSFVLPSKLKVRTRVSEEEDSEADAPAEKPKAANRDPRLVGIAVHRLMERLVSVPQLRERDALVGSVIRECGLPDDYKGLLEEIFDTFMNGGYEQKNGRPGDILAEVRDAEKVSCEMPFCCRLGDSGEICGGVIDLIYRKNGKLYIADYKTTAEAEGLEEEYAGQLEAYKAAIKELTGEQAKAYIYHIEV